MLVVLPIIESAQKLGASEKDEDDDDGVHCSSVPKRDALTEPGDSDFRLKHSNVVAAMAVTRITATCLNMFSVIN